MGEHTSRQQTCEGWRKGKLGTITSHHSHIFFCMPLRMTSSHFQQMGSWLTGYVIVGTDVHIMI